jgi:hypothetical protein
VDITREAPAPGSAILRANFDQVYIPSEYWQQRTGQDFANQTAKALNISLSRIQIIGIQPKALSPPDYSQFALTFRIDPVSANPATTNRTFEANSNVAATEFQALATNPQAPYRLQNPAALINLIDATTVMEGCDDSTFRRRCPRTTDGSAGNNRNWLFPTAIITLLILIVVAIVILYCTMRERARKRAAETEMNKSDPLAAFGNGVPSLESPTLDAAERIRDDALVRAVEQKRMNAVAPLPYTYVASPTDIDDLLQRQAGGDTSRSGGDAGQLSPVPQRAAPSIAAVLASPQPPSPGATDIV